MKYLLATVLMMGSITTHAQVRTQTENVIIITLDGFRWQELFRGSDPALQSCRYVKWPDSVKKFNPPNAEERRQRLLPFFWNEIASNGQLYGNRDLNNQVNCSNPYWFSYPGYHELLVGAVDRKVCSNAKLVNPNSTVLEFLNQQPAFHNSIAAFSTWDVIPYVLRESRSDIPVNAGTEAVNWPRDLTPSEARMNRLMEQRGDRTDSTTFHLALEYLKADRPKVLYISLDETDHFAHADRYDQYLLAAHHADAWIHNLWNWVQQDSGYSNKTTLIITTDHGRGQHWKKSWTHHGRLTLGSGQIWLAVMGPDTPHSGEMQASGRLYQKQIASTLAALLGYSYENSFPVGESIQSIIQPPALIAEAKDPNNPARSIATGK